MIICVIFKIGVSVFWGENCSVLLFFREFGVVPCLSWFSLWLKRSFIVGNQQANRHVSQQRDHPK